MSELHVSRSFGGPGAMESSEACTCRKACCGFVIFDPFSGCPNHSGGSTIRSAHSPGRCPAEELLRMGCCMACERRKMPAWSSDVHFMIVCPECGYKRCPKANYHDNDCTGSNAPGQIGSAYP